MRSGGAKIATGGAEEEYEDGADKEYAAAELGRRGRKTGAAKLNQKGAIGDRPQGSGKALEALTPEQV